MSCLNGLFVVAEGGEGAGKSSALARIAPRLERLGHAIVMTREPGGTPEGSALRSLLLASDRPTWESAAEHLLMAAARVQHVRRVIRPALERGAVVICDRFIGSTVAYQGAGRGLSQEFILQVHAQTTGNIWPDLTLLFDIDPKIGIARSRKRLHETESDEGRFEAVELAFHERVRACYLEQAAANPDQHCVIDASGSQIEVAERALNAVVGLLDRRKA